MLIEQVEPECVHTSTGFRGKKSQILQLEY